MNLEFLDDLQDPYLQTAQGRGVFLAGVLLGYIAHRQVGNQKDEIGKAPLFKQIQFGRMTMKQVKSLLARVPQLIVAYQSDIAQSAWNLSNLTGTVGRFLLEGEGGELGAEGNFAFAVGFTNANDYYWRIFKPQTGAQPQNA